MKPVEFSPAARADLMAIGLYIADDNPERAESFVIELTEHARAIGERPLSYPARDDISAGLRSTGYGRYLIFFRDLPEIVRIIRVLHGARHLGAIAENEEFE